MLKFRLSLALGLMAVFLVSSGFSFGDDNKPDDKDPKIKGTLPALWKKLGLSDDQVQKVYKVETTYRTKIDALQLQIADLKAQQKVDMEKVLTDAQKARLKELKLGDNPDKDKVPDKDKKPAKDEKPKDK